MTPPRARATSHRGSVVAVGYLIDPTLCGAPAARDRVLALWRPGARVRALGHQLVVTGLPPHRVRAELAPGAPLVPCGPALSTVPLADATARALAAGRADAIIAGAGGEARLAAVGADLDVGAWLDLGEPTLVEVSPLATPPTVATAPTIARLDLRSATGVGVPGGDGADSRAAIAAVLAGAPVPAPTRAGWWSRLRDSLSQRLWRSPLGPVLGRRHAAYLQEMIDLFERGELDEAMRRALPLGGDDDPPIKRVSLSPMTPRQDVTVSLVHQAATTEVPLAAELRSTLVTRYRAAADQLIAAGRFDEAAFVLADLLGDVDAAISLLERHQRLELAAQLAEGRSATPGLAVRLWWLAGDHRRAITVARRRGEWAQAIALLQQTDPTAATNLRLAGADFLASCGDYRAAVTMARAIPGARGLALRWIELGLAAGGSATPTLLAAWAALEPAALAEVAARVSPTLTAPGPAGVRGRADLARALLVGAPTVALRLLARDAARALARDVVAGDAGAAGLLAQLVRRADDHALRADLPQLPGPRRAARPGAPPTRIWAAGDTGALEVHDAARLGDGRVAVALGDVGVWLLAATGRVIARFEAPATALVVADHGTRLLATIRRGHYVRVTRIDLATAEARWWCDAVVDGGAPTFDGAQWFTWRGGEVLAIDALATRWQAVWGVDTGGARCRLWRDGDDVAVAVERDGDGTGPVGAEVEAWCYHGHRLHLRAPVPSADGVVARVLVPSASTWAEITTEDGDLVLRPRPGGVRSQLPPGAVRALVTSGDAVVVVQDAAAGLVVSLVDAALAGLLARFELGGAGRVAARVDRDWVTLADDRGRVITWSRADGVVELDARVMP